MESLKRGRKLVSLDQLILRIWIPTKLKLIQSSKINKRFGHKNWGELMRELISSKKIVKWWKDLKMNWNFKLRKRINLYWWGNKKSKDYPYFIKEGKILKQWKLTLIRVPLKIPLISIWNILNSWIQKIKN